MRLFDLLILFILLIINIVVVVLALVSIIASTIAYFSDGSLIEASFVSTHEIGVEQSISKY